MAGGANFGDDDGSINQINVTPLVDVMLVLLIIFMVTTTYIAHRGIEVKLPKADTGEEMGSTRNLAFALDKNANLFLDGTRISFPEVGTLIDSIRAESDTGKLQALISADQQTAHGQVVKLIDTIRKNGITDFAINVEADSGSK